MRDQIKAWRVSAVVAVTTPGSLLAHYLTSLLGTPSVVTSDVISWRAPGH
jgi:hypoxanthine phosphoribosyltransferase